MTDPTPFRFDGKVMVPLVRNAQFETGRVYVLEAQEQRSHRADWHLRMCVQKAFDSLPEAEAKLFKSPEALRKAALIEAGYTNVRIIPLSSSDQAERVAALAQSHDVTCVVRIDGATVCVFTAKSMAHDSMGPEEAKRAKQAILEILAEMIGVSVEELSSNAGI